MHDCTHRTLFRSPRLNCQIGLLLGAITGIDFHSFSTQHWRHHRSYGQLDDPQRFHYAGLKAMTPAQLRWHFFKPLLGCNLLYTLDESVLAPHNVVRLLRSGEMLVVVVVQAVIFALATGGGRHPMLAAMPFLSAATFGLFFSQLRGIAEHGTIGAAVEAANVRSHTPNWTDRILLYDVNFNYHAEHHAHPHCPSYHLPALWKASAVPGAALRASMFGTLQSIYYAARSAHE
jgi:fatty acid desaturase